MSRKSRSKSSKSNKETLKVIPLGGLSEIGRNMLAIEYDGDVLLIDAGLMFPKQYMPGIDYVIPDITYLKDKNILGLILTHGHEDHIGAIAHITKEITPPIFGTKLTLAFVREKVMDNKANLSFTEVRPRERFSLGPFSIEVLRVNHSIADSVGYAIETPLGTIVHTGDFKIEMQPTDDDVIDLYKFAEYGEKGVLLMLSDSTNVERETFSISERLIHEEMTHLFGDADGMVIVVTFASSIHRIQQLVNAAKAKGKRLCISGRSLVKYVDIAKRLGYLSVPDEMMIPVTELQNVPRNSVICITTGSQGEPYSSLSLISAQAHRHISVQAGDIIILSSSIIPGNEVTVNQMINALFKMGASVINEDEYRIHSSGHASALELRMLYRLVRPKYFIPVHGEPKHLIKHAALVSELRGTSEGVFTLYNGDVLAITEDGAEVVDHIPLENVYVDGKGVGDISENILKERLQLASGGVVFVNAVVIREGDSIKVDANLATRGFILDEHKNGNKQLINDAKTKCIGTIQRYIEKGKTKQAILEYETRSALQKLFFRETKREPLLVVSVTTKGV